MTETSTWILMTGYNPDVLIKKAVSKGYKVTLSTSNIIVIVGENIQELYDSLPEYHDRIQAVLPSKLTLMEYASSCPLENYKSLAYTLAQIKEYYNLLSTLSNVITENTKKSETVAIISTTSSGNPEINTYLAAQIVSYMAKNVKIYPTENNDQGLYNSIKLAIQDGMKIIVIYCGLSEEEWPPGTLTAFNSLFKKAYDMGVLIFCSSFSSDTLFPASSPYVISCGGTELAIGGEKANILSSSTIENSRKRQVPDVVANSEGYILTSPTAPFSEIVINGSAAAPAIWAALFACILPQTKCDYKIRELLYSTRKWSPGMGLGSPDGKAISQLFTRIIIEPTIGLIPLTVTFTPAPAEQNVKTICFGDTTRVYPFSNKMTRTYDHPKNYKVVISSLNSEETVVISAVHIVPNFAHKLLSVQGNVKGRTVVFNNISYSNNIDSNKITYTWTFGDKSSSSVKSPTHYYVDNGKYIVTLTATFIAGNDKIVLSKFTSRVIRV